MRRDYKYRKKSIEMASIAETETDDETETDYDGRTFWFKEDEVEEVEIKIERRPDVFPTFENAIDMITLEKLERPVVTTCGHVFSYDTLKKWLTMNDTCPKCRTMIKFNKQVVVYLARPVGRDEEGNVIYHELPPSPLRF
jgi:hypothetical protein